MIFDPHQYVIDVGWDATAIEKTARLGISNRDEEIIREMMADEGFEGDELEEAVDEAATELLCFCRDRVAEMLP